MQRTLSSHVKCLPCPPVIALLAAALLVRLPLLLATPGYDVRDYKAWARVVHEGGIGGAYSAAYPPGTSWLNYPPFYLYILRVTGWLYAALVPEGDWRGQSLAFLLKLSPVLAELALGMVLYRALRQRTTQRNALLWTAAYLLNPAIIWNTAYWGGIDAFHTLFGTSALLLVATERGAWSGALVTLAIGAKLLAVPGALAAVPPMLRVGQPRRMVLTAGGAVLTGLLLAAPIIVRGELGAMGSAMFHNLGNYALVSVNAHNGWWLVTLGDGWRADTHALVPGLSYRLAGLLLFGAVATWAVAGFWPRAEDTVTVCATGAFLTYAFFMLTTEVHENWSFAMFAPLAVAAAARPNYRRLYVALTLTTLANLVLQDPPLRDALGDGYYRTLQTLSVFNALAGCVLLCWWARLLVCIESFPALSWRAIARWWLGEPGSR